MLQGQAGRVPPRAQNSSRCLLGRTVMRLRQLLLLAAPCSPGAIATITAECIPAVLDSVPVLLVSYLVYIMFVEFPQCVN